MYYFMILVSYILYELIKNETQHSIDDDIWSDWLLNSDMKYIKLSRANIECLAYVCKWHMKWRWVTNKSKIAEMVLSLYYEHLRYTTKCDEMWRLYASDFKKWYNRDCELEKVLSWYENSQAFELAIKKLVDWKKIMLLRPDAKNKDIGVLKKHTVEYIVENNFDVTQNDVDLFIINYNLKWECTS